MERRWYGWLLIGVTLAACGHKKGVGPLSKTEVTALSGFEKTVGSIAKAPADQRAIQLSRAVFESVGKDQACLAKLANASPEQRQAVLAPCGFGTKPSGLPAGEEAFASVPWFVAHRTSQLLGPLYQRAKPDRRKGLDGALAALVIPLPLPARIQGGVEVPEVDATATAPVLARTYVVVDAAGKATVGVAPTAAVHPGEAALVVAQGKPFPGESVDLEALGKRVRGLRTQPTDVAPPEKDPATGDTIDNDGEDEEGGTGSAEALDPGPLMGTRDSDRDVGAVVSKAPCITGRLVDAHQTYGDWIGRDAKNTTRATLVLADRRAHATAMVDVASRIPSVLIGAGAAGQNPAAALRLRFAACGPWRNTRSRSVAVSFSDGPVWIAAFDGHRKLPAAASPAELAAAFVSFAKETDHPRDDVDVHVSGGVTVQRVAAVVAALIDAGARSVTIDVSKPPPYDQMDDLTGRPKDGNLDDRSLLKDK